MRDYYQINKSRVIYLSKFYLLVIGAIAALCVGILYYFYTIELSVLLLCAVGFTLAFTAYLVLYGLVTGNYLFQRRRKIYRIPFIRDFFLENNFSMMLTSPPSKLDFVEEVMIGTIGNYSVSADVDEDDPKLITFTFLTYKNILNKEQLLRLRPFFRTYRAEILPNGVRLKLEFFKIKTTAEISEHVYFMSGVLWSEGYMPAFD